MRPLRERLLELPQLGEFPGSEASLDLTARVERGGLIRLGDSVRVLPAPTAT